MKKTSQNIKRFAFYVFLAILAINAALAVLSVLSLKSSFDAVLKAESFLRAAHQINSGLSMAEAGVRGYGLSGDDDFLRQRNEALQQAQGGLEELKGLLPADSSQSARLSEVEKLLQEKLRRMEENVAARRSGGAKAAGLSLLQSHQLRLMDRIRGGLQEIIGVEEGQLARLEAEAGRSARRTIWAWVSATLLGMGLLFMYLRGQGRAMEEQRAALKALGESEERFRSFVDHSPMLAFLKDSSGRMRWMNEAFRKLVPYVREGDDWGSIEEERLKSVPATLEQHRQADAAALQGRRSEYVSEFLDPQGGKHYMLVLRFPVRLQDELLIGCKALDITASRMAEQELADSEARFKAFMDHSPMVSSLKDAEGRYIWLSPVFDSYYPGQRERWMGKSLAELLPGNPALSESELETLKLGTVSQEFRSNPDGLGRTRHWLSFKFPVPLRQGNMLGGIAVDFTEKHEDELKVQAYSRELERSNRELQDFASVAAHDLQEPLRKIRAFGDLLQSEMGGALKGDAREYLGRMQASAGRMQALIEDLLTWSRVGTRAAEFSEVELDAVLRDVLADLELAVQKSGAVLEASPLPRIEADSTQMRQLFQNLLSNAIKFAKPGQAPRLSLRAQERGANVELRFADEGIGFDEKYADKIFTIFQRLHGRAEYEGNGVGLAVCRKIAERHGGSIRAQSSPGQGSEFIVTLPRRQAKGVKA